MPIVGFCQYSNLCKVAKSQQLIMNSLLDLCKDMNAVHTLLTVLSLGSLYWMMLSLLITVLPASNKRPRTPPWS